jgi:ankyrin repeat protein
MSSRVIFNTPPAFGFARNNFDFQQTVEEEEIGHFEVEEINQNFGRKSLKDPFSKRPKHEESVLPFTSTVPTSLCAAAWLNSEAFNKMLGETSNLNAKDGRSFTALHYACSNGNSTITEALLEKGCQANIQDKNGNTPLIIAVTENDIQLVSTLIEHGADPNIQNNFGESALHLSANNSNPALVKFLLEQGSLINQCTLDGVTAIHLAAAAGAEEVVKLLSRHFLYLLERPNANKYLHVHQ